MSSEANVNKILDNLAHKMYYHNYVNGERNLQGTVAIASNGSESGRFKSAYIWLCQRRRYYMASR